MLSRSTSRLLRQLTLGALVGVVALLAFGVRAQASPSPKPTQTARSISISGTGLAHPLTFRQDRQNAAYSRLLAEVSWMDGRRGDVIPSTPADLGPHYLVTVRSGSTVIGRYDLYPDVAGGPRAHRQAIGSASEAWFYAPIDMISTLAGLGVNMPTSVPTEMLPRPTATSTPLLSSLTAIAHQSVTALVLAVAGCVAILVVLGFAARRSHDTDRRRTAPPAIGGLAMGKAMPATRTSVHAPIPTQMRPPGPASPTTPAKSRRGGARQLMTSRFSALGSRTRANATTIRRAAAAWLAAIKPAARGTRAWRTLLTMVRSTRRGRPVASPPPVAEVAAETAPDGPAICGPAANDSAGKTEPASTG